MTWAAPAAAPPAAPLLPGSFAGWTSAAAGLAPNAAASPMSGAVLQEYGLRQTASAVYAEGANRVTVTAWRFEDATGAYGAFTFSRQPQMHPEKIGREGAAEGEHVLFWTGATVVDAVFSHPARDEQAALTALAGELPQPRGGAAVPPSLPHYLPAGGLDPETVRYAVGPAAWAQMGGAAPAADVDFSQDAEAIVAQYGPADARGTLTLILYPTPQIAGAHLTPIEAMARAGGMQTKRSGPLVAVLGGHYPKAKQLLDQVRFSDYVTINHPEGYVSEGAKLYGLLMGITVLTVVLIVGALLLGLFLGGGRALVRVLRGKPVSAMADDDFISLHLENRRES